MNIIEVVKKENVGKSYEIFIDGVSKGVWELKETYGSKDFEFYKDKLILTEAYFSSQLIRMEFEEVMDWSKVPVDTKVLVSKDGEKWLKRYFAKYENEKVYFFSCGASSFSSDDINNVLSWDYAKLYQE